MLASFFSNPFEAIVYLIAIITALTIHEYAHAWAAVKFGDDTPRLMGRLNLNPTSHIDPLGGLMFLILGFGWGKPVVYNPLRLKHRRQELYIALAGPLSNLIAALLIRTLILGFLAINFASTTFLVYLNIVATVNVYLAAFNILPIPPLDGSSIIAYFWPKYRGLFASQAGLILILLLVIPAGGNSLLGSIMMPIITLFQRITLG